MAITYITTTTASDNAACADPGTAGACLIAVWECDGLATCSTPAGWDLLLGPTDLTIDRGTVYVFSKKVSTGSGTYTFTNTSGGTNFVAIYAYSGVDATTPLDGVSVVSTIDNSGVSSPITILAPSITPATAGSTVIFIAVGDPTSGTPSGDSFTPPAGYTSRGLSSGGAGGWCMVALAEKASVTGATGGVSSTMARTGAIFAALGVQLVLRDANGGATATSVNSLGSALVSATSNEQLSVAQSELSLGQCLASAVGGYRYPNALGVAIIDFTGRGGSNVASVVITDQTTIDSTSYIEAFMQDDSTPYHNKFEHLTVPLKLTCGNIVNGVGFTITASSELRLSGKFLIHYVWS